jgi:hypothetical protein
VAGDAGVVGVARTDDAVGHREHRAQRRHRLAQVQEHLVGVHDVEGPRPDGGGEVADVADDELDVVDAHRGRARRREDRGSASTPTTRPGATRRAMSSVIVPVPQPTSSTVAPGTTWSAR